MFFTKLSQLSSSDDNRSEHVLGEFSLVSKHTMSSMESGVHDKDIALWKSLYSSRNILINEIQSIGREKKVGPISDFNGKFVGTITTTQLVINANLPKAHWFRDWYDSEVTRYCIIKYVNRQSQVSILLEVVH